MSPPPRDHWPRAGHKHPSSPPWDGGGGKHCGRWKGEGAQRPPRGQLGGGVTAGGVGWCVGQWHLSVPVGRGRGWGAWGWGMAMRGGGGGGMHTLRFPRRAPETRWGEEEDGWGGTGDDGDMGTGGKRDTHRNQAGPGVGGGGGAPGGGPPLCGRVYLVPPAPGGPRRRPPTWSEERWSVCPLRAGEREREERKGAELLLGGGGAGQVGGGRVVGVLQPGPPPSHPHPPPNIKSWGAHHPGLRPGGGLELLRWPPSPLSTPPPPHPVSPFPPSGVGGGVGGLWGGWGGTQGLGTTCCCVRGAGGGPDPAPPPLG